MALGLALVLSLGLARVLGVVLAVFVEFGRERRWESAQTVEFELGFCLFPVERRMGVEREVRALGWGDRVRSLI